MVKVGVAIVVYHNVSFAIGQADKVRVSCFHICMHACAYNHCIIEDLVDLHNAKPIGGGIGSKNPVLIVYCLLCFVIYFIHYVVPKC